MTEIFLLTVTVTEKNSNLNHTEHKQCDFIAGILVQALECSGCLELKNDSWYRFFIDILLICVDKMYIWVSSWYGTVLACHLSTSGDL